MLRDYLINLLNELKKTPGMKSVFHDWLILEVGATPIEIKSNFENLSDNRISEILHNALCEVVKTTDMNTEEYMIWLENKIHIPKNDLTNLMESGIIPLLDGPER